MFKALKFAFGYHLGANVAPGAMAGRGGLR